MRHRAAVLVALLSASLALPAASADAADWIVLRVKVGPTGTDGISATVTGRAADVEDEPSLVGFGYSYGFDRLVDVVPAGAGTIRVSTTDRTGSLEVAIAPVLRSRQLDVSATLTVDGPIPPHATIGILVFVTGMRFEDTTVTTSDAGIVTIDTWTGAGSTALIAAGARDEGIGAAAGPVAVAVGATHLERIDTGAVGAFVSSGFCIHCTATWSSPSSGGSYTTGEVRRDADHAAVFYGEPGTWRWTWRGIGATRGSGVPVAPTFAAYAPVGDLWPLFRPLIF